MKIGIVAAMQEEMDKFLTLMNDYEELSLGTFKYYSGTLHGVNIIVSLCGIGKVNAAVGTSLLIEKYKPDYIINTGVAGGFDSDKLRVGDIVVSSEVRHHDVDTTIFNYEYGQVPGMPSAFYPDEKLKETLCGATITDKDIKIFEGQILSGDSFIHTEEQVKRIRELFPSVMAVEMEGASIAQSCFIFKVPFVIIRSISDLVDAEESHEVYNQSMEETAGNSVSLVLNLLEVIGKSLEN
ncbi:MAG: 5'-methylthioadenosine/adenosylhomocysteine nucleosidase [Spirochaetales bacterium]|nr:5'-methylthioadenosine/adenosylhomocysteine nucleosidase [Spirochaetales bacterium]